MSAPAAGRTETIEDLRRAVGELLGAERRLRSRDRRGPHGLSFSEVRALVTLSKDHEGPVTAGALAKAADLNPASVTALLDSLEERGIAERRRDPSDRRCVVVTLTDEGREVLTRATDRWQAKLDAALADVPEEDVAAAAVVLRRLSGLFDGMQGPDEQA